MALIKCSECGNQVSSAAASCPKCGVPVAFEDNLTPLATIQHTNKRGLMIENEIWKGNPSYLYYLGHFFFGVLMILLGPYLWPGGLFIILYALLDRKAKLYMLTNKCVMSKAGIISRQIHEVGTKDIRNINVKQGILERLFGLGTVEIASAGTAGIEVEFKGIRDPMRIRDLIRQEKDEADSGNWKTLVRSSSGK